MTSFQVTLNICKLPQRDMIQNYVAQGLATPLLKMIAMIAIIGGGGTLQITPPHIEKSRISLLFSTIIGSVLNIRISGRH